MTSEEISHYRVSNLSEKTSDDCLQYFLLSHLPISTCYVERAPSGHSERSAIFSIPSSSLQSLPSSIQISEDLSSIVLPVRSLDESEISISKASVSLKDSPLLKLFDIPLGTTEEAIRAAIEQHGKVAELEFLPQIRLCKFRMSTCLEAKEVATKGVYIQDNFTPVSFDCYPRERLYSRETSRNNSSSSYNSSYNSSGYNSNRSYGERQENKKVFLHTFAPDFVQEEVLEYFGSFGKVIDSNFVMTEQSGHRTPKYAFIEFEDGKVSEKVVKERDHYIGKNSCVAELSKTREGGQNSGGYSGGYQKKSHYSMGANNRGYQSRGYNSFSNNNSSSNSSGGYGGGSGYGYNNQGNSSYGSQNNTGGYGGNRFSSGASGYKAGGSSGFKRPYSHDSYGSDFQGEGYGANTSNGYGGNNQSGGDSNYGYSNFSPNSMVGRSSSDNMGGANTNNSYGNNTYGSKRKY